MKFVLISLITLFSLNAWSASYHLLTEIPLEKEGGWDYLSVDEANHKLYVTHGDQVVIIDTATNKVNGEIKDTPGVHGIAIASELGKAFTSNGKEGKVSIVDLASGETKKKIPVGANPDAIVYDSSRKQVYTFNGKSKDATVLDARTGNVVATIPLAGKPEFAAVDPELHRIFVNIEDNDTLVAIDTVTHKIVATWPIAPGKEATGIAADTSRHLLFVGCHNNLMLMVDAKTGKVLDQIAIGSGVDSNWYDPKLNFVYSSNGEGTVSIAHITEKGKFEPVQTLKTKARARTMALDSFTHRLYLPSADFKPATEPKARPQMVSGSLKVLVYEQQ